jgi:hypothetical protein
MLLKVPFVFSDGIKIGCIGINCLLQGRAVDNYIYSSAGGICRV